MNRHPLLEVHASDSASCLARYKAEFEGADTDGASGRLGTALHKIAQVLVLANAENPMLDEHGVAAAELRTQRRALNLPDWAVRDALQMLEACLSPRSRIHFRAEDGWSGAPEVHWKLDKNFEFICRECGGTGVTGSPPDNYQDCAACETSPGPEREAVYAGTIDLEETQPSSATVRVTDWKSTYDLMSHEEAYENFQGRTYARAVLAKYPWAQKVIVRFAMLRGGYYAEATFLRDDPWQWAIEAQLAAIRDAREQAAAKNEWPASFGVDCSWCPVIHACTKMAALRASGAEIPADVTIEEAARRMLAARALEKAYTNRVEAHLKTKDGPRSISLEDPKGNVFGFKPTTKWEHMLSKEETIAELRGLGMGKLVTEDGEPWEEATFTFVAKHLFQSAIRKTLLELRIRQDTEDGALVWDRLVVPSTGFTMTTFRPDPEGPGDVEQEISDFAD